METTGDRIEQFKSDVTEMNLKTGSPSRDKTVQGIGFLLMVAGIVIAFLSWVSARNQAADIEVTTLICLALAGVTLTLAGAALYLRYALANFLRMWLLRQLYEGQANTDRIVDAVSKR
jgi:hypothetical protein